MKIPKIAIVIDTDGDGAYSFSILYHYLYLVFPNIEIIPIFHKYKAHGLSKKVMQEILSAQPDLVICPDSASDDIEQHHVLHDNKIHCIVLDHHEVDKKDSPAIIVNNKLSPNIINTQGSGALVTWKFMKALDIRLGVNYAPYFIDMVYFSLVSDSCDMSTIENRTFAYYGTQNINNEMILALIDSICPNKDINNITIGFNIQPKVSAIIRSGNQELIENLMYGLAVSDEDCITEVIKEYKSTHADQRKLVEKKFNELEVDESNNIIFEEIDISPYYTGLVGSKLNNKYGKPCILYYWSNGVFIGSVRSPYPIKQTLIDSGLFRSVGGHDAVCGCTFTKENFQSIKKFVREIDLVPMKELTAKIDARELDRLPTVMFEVGDKYSDIWGKGIPKPIFFIENIKINSKDILTMGKLKTTIKFRCKDIEYIKFFVSHDYQKEQLHTEENVELNMNIIGSLQINEFNGRKTKQVLIDEVQFVENVVDKVDIPW